MRETRSLKTFLSVFFFSFLVVALASPTATACVDADGDDYGVAGAADCPNPGVDCDDTNANVFPGAIRICDGLDTNCDGRLDFRTDVDADGDGVPRCGGDCDDNDASNFPGNQEICDDGQDNDCDRRVDTADLGGCVGGGGPVCGNGIVESGEQCDGGVCCNSNCTFAMPSMACTDNGLFCDGAESCNGSGGCVSAGNPCPGGTNCIESTDTCDTGAVCGNGTVETGEQCDGGECCDPDCTFSSTATACSSNGVFCDGTESCNGSGACVSAGDPCTGGTTCNEATDRCDAVGVCGNGIVEADEQCDGGLCCNNDCTFAIGACDDSDPCTSGDTCSNGDCVGASLIGLEGPVGSPTCSDGCNNDFDGMTDAADSSCVAVAGDNDGDGVAVAAGDCDDTDPTVYPGALRICDGKDNNCDSRLDFSSDVDADGDGVARCASDCDDNNPKRYPDNLEVCTDGIDNDCDNLTDAADLEDCGPPTCGTVTTPRDEPHLGQLLNPDGTIHPDNNALFCGKCHNLTNFLDDTRYQCQRCHADPNDTSDPLNGVLKAQYPDAYPFGFGSAANVVTHSSGILGNKYGTWGADCVNCHNPHTQEQNNKFGTTYGKLIKRTICFDNQTTGGSVENFVEFTAPTGPGSFADGAPYDENICNTCHTRTNHQQSDGTAPGGQDHNNGLACTACHSHADGFAPTGGTPAAPHDTQEFLNNCDYCHVSTSDFSSPIPDSKCEQCHAPTGVLKDGFPAAPNVLTHSDVNGSGTYSYTNQCVDCHNPMFEQTNLKLVRSTVPGSVIPGSVIDFTARSGPGSFADGPPHEENVCETCHSATNHHQSDGTAPGGQSHLDGNTCTTCHPHSEGFLLTSASIPNLHHQRVGTPIIPDSIVPKPDANGDGVPDATYDCLNCHSFVWDPDLGAYILEDFRDCTTCHEQ